MLLGKLLQKGSRGRFLQLTPLFCCWAAARGLACSFVSSLLGSLPPLPGWCSIPASHTQSQLLGCVQHSHSAKGGAAVQPRLSLQANSEAQRARALPVASGATLPGALRPHPHPCLAAAP